MLSTELQRGMTVALLMYLSCAGATAQSDAPRFEVASIRPAAIREPAAGERRGGQGGAGCGAERFVMDGSIVRCSCISLSALIAHAFRMPIIGSDWMSQISPPKFDIVAKIPEGVSNAQVPE